jgi:hypothetical protein
MTEVELMRDTMALESRHPVSCVMLVSLLA